jgi:peroxiredoxin
LLRLNFYRALKESLFMKKLPVISLMIALVAIAIAGNVRTTSTDVPAPPAIGATIVDFTLPDADGKDHSLNSLKGKNGTVLIFVAVQCPISNAYNERMEKLAQDYKARGISVVGINPNSTEPAADVKKHAAQSNLTFPILKDNGNKIADSLGATRTPEAYFLDANNKLVYHGRIDNSRDVSQVNSSELRDALEATLAGKPVAKTTANAFGCSIKRA